MTSADESFRSITGQHESAEPSAAPSTTPAAAPSASNASNPPLEPGPVSHAKRATRSGPRSLNVSASQSASNSPLSSRDSSPHRPRHSGTAGPLPKSGLRSRKNSSADVSPSRGPSLAGSNTTVPSAASIQRALSSTNMPQLQPMSANQDPARVPRPQKTSSGTNSGDITPHWPISPRLKSPPPDDSNVRSSSRRNSLRAQPKKNHPGAPAPSIVVQSSSPASTSRIPAKDEAVVSDNEEQPALTMKGSSRGASGVAPKLETVQEASLPTTPGFDEINAPSLSNPTSSNKLSDDDRHDVTKAAEDSSKPSRSAESGSDSAGKNGRRKSPGKRSASSQRPAMSSKASVSSLSTIRSRAEPSTTNMTVETETVTSIPQAPIGGGQDRSVSGRAEPGGSVRLKPSNETIRPRKERQRPKRKAPSIHSGTASSKADVFEAKVASAVDEAPSSDSDETFVYESNPPEPPPPHRSRRHHSRTPSMTSINSLADPRSAARDAHRTAGKKTSMKFTNNPYAHGNPDFDGNDRGEGTVRGTSGRVTGGTYHHHIGQHRQGRGALHIPREQGGDSSSLPAGSSVRIISNQHSSQPTSPRFQTFRVQNGNGNGSGKKNGEYSSYDIDSAGVADDERTPLIRDVRTPRSIRASRRPGSASRRQLEHQRRRNSGCFRRFAGCLVLSIIILVVIFSAIGLVFATTKPLHAVKVREIQNVIATKEEIMLDMLVDAVNPNINSVTITDMDVNIFAKSKHVGSDRWWREHGGHRTNEEDWLPVSDITPESMVSPQETVTIPGGVDEGTDPIEAEPRTMLLGRIFHFDSALNFDGTFFNRHSVESLGELRLAHPGNKTEIAGPERWEEVLQYPFDLILRGVFKYQLPLSTREHTIPITASYHYDPDEEKKKVKVATPTVKARRALFEESVPLSTTWGRWNAEARRLLQW